MRSGNWKTDQMKKKGGKAVTGGWLGSVRISERIPHEWSRWPHQVSGVISWRPPSTSSQPV